MTNHDAANTVRALYTAYQARDRELADRLLAKDFRFTSPHDDAIDKKAYFERCWPPGDDLAAFVVESVVTDGNAVLLHYRARWRNGHTADNVERLVVEDGKVKSVHVFFGRAPDTE